MKIAINRCYGGFSLSDKAIEMIMKRKGLECYRYVQTKYSYKDGVNEYTKITGDNPKCRSLFVDYLTRDLGDTTNKLPDDAFWYYGSELARTDSDLISVIEELGDDASGNCGDIRIIEIPNGVDYEINDYDGMESVHEVHRSWC